MTTAALTVRELQLLHLYVDNRGLPSIVAFAQQAGIPIPALRDKLVRMIAEGAGARSRGAKVYEIALPLSRKTTTGAGKEYTVPIAPTLNAYESMKPWVQAKVRKEVDARIMAELHRWPAALLRGQRRARQVVVTRRSSSMPDEISVDVVGGKIPIDRLVHLGVLAGDTQALLDRDAQWRQARPGEGALVVEVFEVAEA